MTVQSNGLLRYLPEIYHDSKDLQNLLAAFEEVLIGSANPGAEGQGLEQKIAGIPDLFDPYLVQQGDGTSSEFLRWLADWVALEHVYALPDEQIRHLIAHIVPLYAIRGTKRYLLEIAALFFPDIAVTVYDEALPSLKVGESRVGIDTRLGGDLPFQFYVKALFPKKMAMYPDSIDVGIWEKRLCAVIDAAKPAHTSYRLESVSEDQDRQGEVFFDSD